MVIYNLPFIWLFPIYHLHETEFEFGFFRHHIFVPLWFEDDIDIDIFDSNGKYYISEVNPRFGGGYPHAYESGCDHMKLILNNLNGIVNKKNIGAYEEGIYMMKYNEVYIRKGL